MSGKSLLGYGIGIIAGAIAGFLAPGVGFSWFWGLAAFSVTSSLLVRPPIPTNTTRPTDFGASGRAANTREAAAASLNVNSATEAVAIPVIFGTVRVNANHIGYSNNSFRSVPITERHERAPQAVAYRIAQETFETAPSVVDHEIDRAARKNSGGGGKGGKSGGGGKGGSGGTPPPSQSYSNNDKINAYTQVLLDKDASGQSRLPKEFDEVTIGFKYYLTFELGIAVGEISALHAVLAYPGETVIADRYASPYITADATTITAAGPQQGGTVIFYRGSGTQARTEADPRAQDYNNYRGTAFAVFDDFYIGNQPTPESMVFEVERMPVCRDSNGDEIPIQTRAGFDTTPVAVTAAVWADETLTITAPDHGLNVGDVALLSGFDPEVFDGVYTVLTVDGDDITATLTVPPEDATKFGTAQGPPVDLTPEPVLSATWSDAVASLEVANHGLTVGQLAELTGFTGSGWNGTFEVLTIDGDEFTLAMPFDPGDATTLGDFRAYPQPSTITAVSWSAGVATFQASNGFQDGDSVTIAGMLPAIYNGVYTVLDGDGSSFDVTLVPSPVPAVTMGTAQGPAIYTARNIGSAEWEGGIVTFDMQGTGDHGYRLGDRIAVEGCTPSGYNGTFEVTHYDGDQWSGALATDPGALTVEGTATKQTPALTIEAAKWDAGLVTFTVPRHFFLEGDSVTVAGMEPAGYNGTFTVTDITGDQWSAALATDPGEITETGTIRLRPAAGYGDANPAAVLWEILTNKTWGRGLDPSFLDSESFAAAADFYYNEEIGLSFMIESQQSLSSVIETIRAHVNLAVWWQGDRLYCRCLEDRANAYLPLIQLSRDSIQNVRFSRAAWPDTFNEIRVQFENRGNNFGSELAAAHDDANFAFLEQINSRKVDLPAISNRATATRVAQRLLTEQSYPLATISFTMARFHSGLHPSAFVELAWPDWSGTGQTAYTYWRVTEISDEGQNPDGIRVQMVEDAWSTPTIGAVEEFTAPVPAFEGMARNTDSDLYLAEDKRAAADLSGLIHKFAEIGIKLTDGERIIGITAQRRDGFTAAVSYYWRPAGTGDDFRLFGRVRPWAIACYLQERLDASDVTMTRQNPFEIQTAIAGERAKIIESASALAADSDGFDYVTGAEKCWLIIGTEFIQVGLAEASDSGPNRVSISAFLRGGFGSEVQDHAAGTLCFFVYDFIPYQHTVRWEQAPVDTLLDIKAVAEDRHGNLGTPQTFQTTITGLARKALRIERISAEVDGSDWIVTYRPRFHNRGADIFPDIEATLNALTQEIPEGYELRVMPENETGGSLLSEPAKVEPTLVPDDGETSAAGLASFTYTPPAGAVALTVYQTFNGVLGLPKRIRIVGTDPEMSETTGVGGAGDPEPDPSILRVLLSASDLTNSTGTEAWDDQDTTDGQNNGGTINWTYSPLSGSKPTLDADSLTGNVGGFMQTEFAVTALPTAFEFEFAFDSKFAADTWASSGLYQNIFSIGQELDGSGFSGQFQIQVATMSTTTLGLKIYVYTAANPFGGTTAGPVLIPLDARHEIGFRAVNITPGGFDIELTVDGVTQSTTAVPFDLQPISGIKMTTGSGGSSGLAGLQLQFFGFSINSIP